MQVDPGTAGGVPGGRSSDRVASPEEAGSGGAHVRWIFGLLNLFMSEPMDYEACLLHSVVEPHNFLQCCNLYLRMGLERAS